MDQCESNGIKYSVFIMDNVMFHRGGYISAEGVRRGFSIMCLPPNSPFLNPIENMFAKWKQYVRCGRPSNTEELISMMMWVAL